MKQRIYIDTSVVGGYFDEEFKNDTIPLFERLEKGEIIFVVSDLLDLELINAPQKVRDLLHNFSTDKFNRIELTEEAIKLADTYIAEKVVGKTSLEDCRHIAMATIDKVDVLASWNFKHIVNLDKIKGYNSVNLKLGYQMIEIRSPKDLIIMETSKKEKTFDAVKMMRDIRDKISSETQNMTFAELKNYMQVKMKDSKLKPIGQ